MRDDDHVTAEELREALERRQLAGRLSALEHAAERVGQLWRGNQSGCSAWFWSMLCVVHLSVPYLSLKR